MIAKQLPIWLQSRSVLSSFGVVLMSCKVNFHEHCSILVRLSSTQDAVLDYDKFEQQQKTFFIFDYPLMHFQQIVIQFG